MRQMTKGVIAGSIAAALGTTFILNNTNARSKMMKSGKKLVNKAGDMIDDVKDNMK